MTGLPAADGHVVTFHYTLRDDDGDILDSSAGGEPMDYLHGEGGIVPGLESAMVGKSAGDKFKVSVAPKDGYGEVGGPGPREVPRDAFPDDMELEEGMQFFVPTKSGEPVPVWVTGFQGKDVLIDTNHPLAGETLHFEVEVVGVRAASKEEIQHGHPHGPDGHGHHHHH